MIPLRRLQLWEPRDVEDAVRLMRTEGTLTPLAGCTDVYVDLNLNRRSENRFINLWGLDELRRITERDGILFVGALATFSALRKSRLIRKHFPMLTAAAIEIGGPQVQNRGTLGGNIVTGSPAGDTLPVLAVAEATLVLRSLDQERRVPFQNFYSGYRENVRRTDELLLRVEIPFPEGRQWFRKVGTRSAQAISKVVVAGLRENPPRIALGSVGPTVRRAPMTEACLANGGSLEEAQATLIQEITPIDDHRASAAYRHRVAQNLLGQFWRETQ